MQDILVRAQTLEPWDAGVEAAAQIAAHWRGSLTAVHVVPIGLPALMPYDPGMLAAAAALEAARQRRDAEQLAPRFDAWATSMGARNPAWLASVGDVSQAMQYVAGWHDLLVTVLDAASDDAWSRASGIGKLVLTTGLPTLVLPAASAARAVFGTVVVAWNGSPAAIRALHGAGAFIREASRVVVLKGDARVATRDDPSDALPHWLARHRPDAVVRELGDIGDGGEPTGATLLDAARREAADLLVMGAYGHSRFSEWVLGGVTRHTLEHADMPLLLRH